MKTSTSVLIGAVAALAVIGIYAAVTHKVPGPWYSNPVASSTPATSTLQNVGSWKTFTSDTYRFSFKYPEYYPEIAEFAADEVIVRKYNSATRKISEIRIKPVASWRGETDPRSANPEQSITVKVYRDADYGFVDYPGGIGWSYDAVQKTMWKGSVNATSSWSKVQAGLSGMGWKAYEAGAGDAGHSVRTAIVPLAGKMILELNMGTGPESKGQPPFNQMLSTLKLR